MIKRKRNFQSLLWGEYWYFPELHSVACRTGGCFLQFSGEQRQAWGKHRVQVTGAWLVLCARFLKNIKNNVCCACSYTQWYQDDVNGDDDDNDDDHDYDDYYFTISRMKNNYYNHYIIIMITQAAH